MIKFTIVTAANKTEAPQSPWEKLPTYSKTVIKDGRTYELVKYVRNANYWERFVCILSAAWEYINRNQEKATSSWNKAMGRKKLSLRQGSEPPAKPITTPPSLENPKKEKSLEKPKPEVPKEKVVEPRVLEIYEQGLIKRKNRLFIAAAQCFHIAAGEGYRPALDAFREMCEQEKKLPERSGWSDFFQVARNCVDRYGMKVMQFSDEERIKIKSAIFANNGEALFDMGQAFEKQCKYPETFLCHFVAVVLAHVPSVEAIARLQRTGHGPSTPHELMENYLSRAHEITYKKERLKATPQDMQLNVNFARDYSFSNYLPQMMDTEIAAWCKEAIKQTMFIHFMRAAEQGDGFSLTQIKYMYEDKYPEAQRARNAALKNLEAEAHRTNNISLFYDLGREYEESEVQKLALKDVEGARAWLDKIAKGHPGDLEVVEYLSEGHRYKQAEVFSQAAKRGCKVAMSALENRSFYGIPQNYKNEVIEAFKVAAQPQINELLNQPDINDNIHKIGELIGFYIRIDMEQANKWRARREELEKREV